MRSGLGWNLGIPGRWAGVVDGICPLPGDFADGTKKEGSWAQVGTKNLTSYLSAWTIHPEQLGREADAMDKVTQNKTHEMPQPLAAVASWSSGAGGPLCGLEDTVRGIHITTPSPSH